MTIHEFANMLNGREYRREITTVESMQAADLGFVVVFGASDDLIEFSGAIDDEADCYDGGIIYFSQNGLFEDCDSDCKYSMAAKELYKTIEAIWDDGEYSWTYKTDIPHATFEILEDGDKYCKGIVFDIKEAQ